MMCIAIGALCLLAGAGVAKAARRHRRWRLHSLGFSPWAHAGGCGAGPFGPWPRGGWHEPQGWGADPEVYEAELHGHFRFGVSEPWGPPGFGASSPHRFAERDGVVWPGHGRFGKGRGFGKGGPFSRHCLQALLQELDASAQQEKLLAQAFEAFRDTGRQALSELRKSREQWASALEAEVFDEGLVGAAVADFERSVESMRKASLDAFASVHAALEPEQRKKLARWLRRRF